MTIDGLMKHSGNHNEETTVNTLLSEAVALHQAGKLSEAEALYGRILQQDSRSSPALYGVGVIAHQVGKNDIALQCLNEAIRLDPAIPAYFNMRGLVSSALGNVDGAMQDFRHAIKLQPDFADAYNSLGVTLKKANNLDGAIDAYRKAVQLNPEMAMAHNNLANSLKEKGSIDEAVEHYQRALQLQPGFAEAHNNLGTLCVARDELVLAEQQFQQALSGRPGYSEALSNLGVVHKKRGDLEGAKYYFRKALETNPGYSAARTNLASVLNAENEYYAAIDECRKALETSPESPEAYFNLGLAFKELGLPTKALKYFETAVQLRPDYAGAYNGIANIYRDQGRYELAEKYYRQGLEHDPDNHEVHSNLLFVMSHHVLVTPDELLQAHRQWADIHCREGRAHRFRIHRNSRSLNRRLRIGYVSPDFRRHAVSFFLEPLLAAHDNSSYEIYAYAEVSNPDGFTERCRAAVDHWCNTVGMSDAALAGRVAEDQIDILVDLAGHTAGNRLKVFAWKPAPVQVTYLGYCATTGLDEMDYWITDEVIHPVNTHEKAVETIIRLPRCWVCYQAPSGAPAVQIPERDSVIFGCFNDRSKITNEVVRTWAAILKQVPEARLLLKARQYADDGIKAVLLDAFQQQGVNKGRIVFQTLSLPDEYMAAYSDVDIALDPFPRHGGVTTADTLWMGVPVVTLIGERFIERHCASLLTAMGGEAWIAATPDQYIEIAVSLARHKEQRIAMRVSQRQRMADSPLCDAVGMAHAIEQAYREMWRQYLSRSEVGLHA